MKYYHIPTLRYSEIEFSLCFENIICASDFCINYYWPRKIPEIQGFFPLWEGVVFLNKIQGIDNISQA